MMDMFNWQNASQQAAVLVEKKLADLLGERDQDFSLLFEGMRYSALAGGKRIRPFLTLSIAQLFGGDEEPALSFAAAVEMVHTYSLIHDDLPCMDDDDYRRGRLTNHKVYGEAEAVLAGDALLTMAFEVIANAPADADCRIRAVHALSSAAGARGMVGGQMMDMKAERETPSLATLRRLHDCKTGALIRASAALGCIAAGVQDEDILASCHTYANGIGRAFQIVDDILDVYGDSRLLGKNTGQDAKDGKTTYLSYMTKQEAMQEAVTLTEQAKDALRPYRGSEMLLSFADALLNREK
ncbi:MAG: polyprenyl synthetase family protein [Clostridia bacterium]|nr:polyprenyl synthetase family protein [Clostridia bacterium]